MLSGHAHASYLLPLEIWEGIIGLLWNDPHALLACWLTCHYLAPLCKTRIGFLKLALRSSRFLVQEISKSPGIEDCVTDLSIGSEDMNTAPVLLAGRLKKLRRLLLDHVHIGRTTHVASLSFLLTFRTIRALSLWQCTFASFSALIRLIVNLPRLEDLTLQGVVWMRHDPLPHHIARGKSQCLPLRSLYFFTFRGDGLLYAQFLSWMRLVPSVAGIESFGTSCDFPADMKELSHFLHVCRDLRELRLTFPPGHFSSSPSKWLVDDVHRTMVTNMQLE